MLLMASKVKPPQQRNSISHRDHAQQMHKILQSSRASPRFQPLNHPGSAEVPLPDRHPKNHVERHLSKPLLQLHRHITRTLILFPPPNTVELVNRSLNFTDTEMAELLDAAVALGG